MDDDWKARLARAFFMRSPEETPRDQTPPSHVLQT